VALTICRAIHPVNLLAMSRRWRSSPMELGRASSLHLREAWATI
jgi:hypothetical protein